MAPEGSLVPMSRSPRRAPRRARTAALLLVPALGLTLAACTPTVALHAADDAENALCAEVVVRLPEQVQDLAERYTDAQGTGAWGTEGESSGVLLRCGVPVPDPTSELLCVTVGAVDWLADPQDDTDVTVFTTYGRDPAVEVVVDATQANGQAALEAVGSAVASIPAETTCVGVGDANTTPTPSDG
jgi:hypothetical protein